MALRDVVLRATLNETSGDEVVELWLKRGAELWVLEQTLAIEETDPTQDFAINSLEEGVVHVAQLRASREGRYRAGYFGSDPDGWPAGSRIEFLPGASAALAPTIVSASWARSSAVAQAITVVVTPHPDYLALNLELLRDGVVVATVVGPHVGDVNMVDADPPLAASYSYTARHVELDLNGALSAATVRWAGPDKPTGVVETSDTPTHIWYEYRIGWTAPVAGATTRVGDNYLCAAAYAERGVTAANAVAFSVGVLGLEKASAAGPGDPRGPVGFNARARHEVTAFAVSDVSDWTVVAVALAEVANDETAFNSCP